MAHANNDDQALRNQVLHLLLENRSRLFAFILSIVRNFDAAEEVFQEVSLVVCEQWADFRLGTDFGAWSRQIARNKIHNLRRQRAGRNILLSPEAIEALDAAAVGTGAGGTQHELAALRDCVTKLNRKAQDIVHLRYGRGFDCGAIAKSMQTSVAAIHMALSRIRVRLADCVRTVIAQEAC